ncbi:MAG: type II CAAX endopeptidase family protein [Candidatus Limnocylindrales bacterium]
MTGPGADEQPAPDEPTPDEPAPGSGLPADPGGRDLPARADPGPDGRNVEPDPAEVGAESEGPLGGGIFSLEGRRAPGLYLVAWVLTVGGLAVTFVLGPMASDPAWRPVLVFAGALAVTLGLAAGAGSQVLERVAREPERYRGPAPLLVFGVYFFSMSLVGLVLLSVMGVDPDRPFSFLGIGVVQAAGYLLVVWLFAVRSGALAWPDMGWPTWRGSATADLVRGAGAAVLVMLPVTATLLVIGGVVGLLLCTEAPQILPLSETFADGVFVVFAAAIAIPVGEEIFFRGFAQTAWTRDLGERRGLIVASVFFALVHIANIDAVAFGEGLAQAVLTLVVIGPVGLVLGWLFARYGLLAAISGHVTYNSLLLALAYIASRVPEPDQAPLQGWCG